MLIRIFEAFNHAKIHNIIKVLAISNERIRIDLETEVVMQGLFKSVYDRLPIYQLFRRIHTI